MTNEPLLSRYPEHYLAALLSELRARAPAGVTVEILEGRLCFDGPTGPHSLALDASTEARARAHWEGYLEEVARKKDQI